MQWSQIKTIFIVCFLVLNVYLLIQFLNKQEQDDLSVLERQESTIEDELEADNITYVDLPEEESKESFMSVGQRIFSEEELSHINSDDNQEVILVNDSFIVSQFDQYPKIPSDGSKKGIEETVRGLINFPEDYVFWDWNKEMNVLIFFQLENDRPIYFNRNGLILAFLNDQNEIVFYTQAMLDEGEPRQEKKKLIKPIQAIETLYSSNELHMGDEITKMDIGFHTRVPSTHGVQVFVPTWKVTVNKNRNYFVNAIEGFVFMSEEIDFLEETITVYLERFKESKNIDKINKNIINILAKKIETDS